MDSVHHQTARIPSTQPSGSSECSTCCSEIDSSMSLPTSSPAKEKAGCSVKVRTLMKQIMDLNEKHTHIRLQSKTTHHQSIGLWLTSTTSSTPTTTICRSGSPSPNAKPDL